MSTQGSDPCNPGSSPGRTSYRRFFLGEAVRDYGFESRLGLDEATSPDMFMIVLAALYAHQDSNSKIHRTVVEKQEKRGDARIELVDQSPMSAKTQAFLTSSHGDIGLEDAKSTSGVGTQLVSAGRLSFRPGARLLIWVRLSTPTPFNPVLT